MKKTMKALCVTAAAIMMFAMTACGGSVPENTVFSVDDMANKTIGVQLGTTGDIFASDYADKAGGETKVEQYSKGADAVQALVAGKVDCVVIDNEPAKVFVQNNPGLVILDTEYITEEYAIAVGKENTELMTKIETALNELIADGTVASIIAKYIPAE